MCLHSRDRGGAAAYTRSAAMARTCRIAARPRTAPPAAAVAPPGRDILGLFAIVMRARLEQCQPTVPQFRLGELAVRILALADNDDFKWAGSCEPVDVVVSCGDVYVLLILSAARGCSLRHPGRKPEQTAPCGGTCLAVTSFVVCRVAETISVYGGLYVNIMIGPVRRLYLGLSSHPPSRACCL